MKKSFLIKFIVLGIAFVLVGWIGVAKAEVDPETAQCCIVTGTKSDNKQFGSCKILSNDPNLYSSVCGGGLCGDLKMKTYFVQNCPQIDKVNADFNTKKNDVCIEKEEEGPDYMHPSFSYKFYNTSLGGCWGIDRIKAGTLKIESSLCVTNKYCTASPFLNAGELSWVGATEMTIENGMTLAIVQPPHIYVADKNVVLSFGGSDIVCSGGCEGNGVMVTKGDNWMIGDNIVGSEINIVVNTVALVAANTKHVWPGDWTIVIQVSGRDNKDNYYLKLQPFVIHVTGADCAAGNLEYCANNPTQCFIAKGKCESRFNTNATFCRMLDTPELCHNSEPGSGKGSRVCLWDKKGNRCQPPAEAAVSKNYPEPASNWLFPRCAFDGTCRSVNNLLDMLIRGANWLFTIIGSLAFLFFIYGGFTMILSFGNAEKVKKGQGILIAAVIGMAIAFGAFLLIKFLLTALNVSNDFIAPALRH